MNIEQANRAKSEGKIPFKVQFPERDKRNIRFTLGINIAHIKSRFYNSGCTFTQLTWEEYFNGRNKIYSFYF